MKIQENIPVGWIETTLGESLSQVISGSGFPKQYQGRPAGEFPFAKVGDISRKFRGGDKFISEAQHYINEDIRAKIKAKIFPEASIVFPKIGEALKGNYRVISKREMLFDNNVMGVVSANGVLVDFLYYFLMTQDFGRFSVATAVPSVRRGDIEAISLLLPPTSEQHRIVAKIEELFSELDKGIESLKTAQEQLKVYRQALLKHAFEGKLTEQWRKDNADKLETADQLLKRIKQEREARHQQQLEEWKVAVKRWEAGGKDGKKPSKPKPLKDYPSISEAELEDLPDIPNGWLWIRLGNLFQASPQNGVYKPSSEYGHGNYIVRIDDFYDGKLVRFNGFKRLNLSQNELEKYLLATGDILINRVNSIEYLGKCCEVKFLGEDTVFESNIMKLRMLDDVVLGDYLTSCLASHEGRNRLCSNAKHAVNQASINQTDVSMAPIPVCSVSEQCEIIEVLGNQFAVISSMVEEMGRNLLRSEALRQSILKKAFSGQLVPQDPNDEPASVLLERIAKEKEASAVRAKKAKKAKPAKKRAKKEGRAQC